MPEVTSPNKLDDAYRPVLVSRKQDLFVAAGELSQNGAVWLDMTDWLGWPEGLVASDPVIETFVGSGSGVESTGDVQPFVDAWQPLADWMNRTVRNQLRGIGVEVEGDAYITASLTDAELLEGTAHLDDDSFIPDDSVGVVAIIGQHQGPRIAVGSLAHPPVRPMSQVVFSDDVLSAFSANQLDHCRCEPDQLVLFPQFGQLHAGPAAADMGPEPTRQLLVMRAQVAI